MLSVDEKKANGDDVKKKTSRALKRTVKNGVECPVIVAVSATHWSNVRTPK